PELVSDPRFAGAPHGIPLEHRPALRKIISDIVSTKTRAEWLRIFQENDAPCAPVMTREEFINDPQVIHNGMRVEVNDDELGKTVQMGVPVKLSRTPGAIRRSAPLLGQHTKEVMNELKVPIKHHTTPTQPFPQAVLSGVRVVDFAQWHAGGQIGWLLAEMGAEVVKVETFDGDPCRIVAYAFMCVNRGKRSISVDLRSKQGQEVVHRLIKDADIVLENFRPGVAKRINMDYDTLQHINPEIIYCSVTGYGSSGPYSKLPGYDPLIQARSGVMKAQGGRQGNPIFLWAPIFDFGCALIAAYGSLAALYHRQRTGEGQQVEASILSTGLAFQSGNFIYYDGKGPEADGGTDLIGLSALCRLYQARDSWLMLSIQESEQWKLFVSTFNQHELTSRYSAKEAMSSPVDSDLALTLEKIFLTRPVNEWLKLLQSHVYCAPVLSYRDIYHNAQVMENELLTIEDHPDWGRVWVAQNCAKFSDITSGVTRGTPRLGEHTEEILKELGFDTIQIKELREQTIVL
ncbi:CoA transferase, partial [Chloroflexota bacterium]